MSVTESGVALPRTQASSAPRVEVERILRVDHAGEFGAINIYRAQLALARWFYKDIAPKLAEMLAHEREHFRRFDTILKARRIRSCYALYIWAAGGAIVGFLTGLLGRNAIWVCTDSIESTVLHHLEWQLAFLEVHDAEVHDAVLSIKGDEEAHREFGQTNGVRSPIYAPVFWVVRRSTEIAIWLSTKL
jgi:ubiquinone biosynthesis monooxygenase Coq7